MESERGHWVAVTPGSLERLPEDERRAVERLRVEREAARGRLLAVVAVRVYERDAVPQVTFPAEAQLDADADRSVVAGVVARARQALSGWR